MRFTAQSCGIAVILGFLISRKVLFAPGIVGLIHDWSVPPVAAQNATLANQIFNGWYTWGLGMPVVFPTEYPLKFALGLAGAAGVSGAVLSKIIVAGLPALAFLSAVFLFSRLRIAPWASWIAAVFYALNPVMLNKLVSGQSTYLLGYAALPVVLASFLEARSSRHWLWVGIQIGGMLALAAVQIQLGLVAYAVVVVAALCAADVPVLRRLAIIVVASVCFFVAELPTVIGMAAGIASFDKLQIFRPNQAWVDANSVHPLEALRLSGYLTHYDASAVRGFIPLWSVAGFIVATAAVFGYLSTSWWLRTFALVCGLGALFLVTGIYGPIGPLISWLFVHVRAMEVLRELYHVMAALALVYAIGLAFYFHSAATDWRRFAGKAVVLVALGIYVMPMLSGNIDGWLRVFGYSADMGKAYAIVSHNSQRTVWFPMDQPLAYDGRGAGVDPMYVTRGGSFWLYTLTWPFSAIDMAARAHRWREVQAGLQYLSVGSVVERPLFSSRLANFIPPNTDSMSAYLQEPMPRLALGTVQQHIINGDIVGALPGARPLAFSTSAVAIVPPRIDLLPYAPRDAVLLPYSATLPANVPYIVITRAGNEADEALTNVPQLAIPSASGPNQGFAPIRDWWWYRPEYAEASSGWLAIGEHRVDIPIATSFSDAVLVLSLQATPVGGRIEIAAGGRHWMIDTGGRSDSIFSRTFDVGSMHAGSSIRLRTEDPGDDVALLSARLVERSQYEEALAALHSLRHGARRVIAFRTATLAYHAVRRGVGSRIGSLDPERAYTLRITYSADYNGYVNLRNQSGYIIARERVSATGARSCEMRFDGFDDEFSLSETQGVRIGFWQLASASRQDAAYPEVPENEIVPAQWNPDGSAVFRDRLLFHTLNESFSPIWGTSVPVLAHVQSMFGTNVYITNGEGPISIQNIYATLQRSAYIIGSILIFAALLLLATGPRWTRTRAQSAEDA